MSGDSGKCFWTPSGPVNFKRQYNSFGARGLASLPGATLLSNLRTTRPRHTLSAAELTKRYNARFAINSYQTIFNGTRRRCSWAIVNYKCALLCLRTDHSRIRFEPFVSVLRGSSDAIRHYSDTANSYLPTNDNAPKMSAALNVRTPRANVMPGMINRVSWHLFISAERARSSGRRYCWPGGGGFNPRW